MLSNEKHKELITRSNGLAALRMRMCLSFSIWKNPTKKEAVTDKG